MTTKKTIVYGFLAVILALSMTACSKSGGVGSSSSGGGKSLNSAAELKEYLDKQPANSPDQPVKVAMKANDMMIKDIAEVIKNAGKYVSLDLSGSPLTEIPGAAFENCKTLAVITIPDSVTRIGVDAFSGTTWLNNQPDGLVYAGKIALTYKGTMPTNTSIILLDGTKGIAESAFFVKDNLTSITIPNSVTSIGYGAFEACLSLTSVTFQGTIPSSGLNEYAFSGDLRDKYLAGSIGTYTTTARVNVNSKWTKQ